VLAHRGLAIEAPENTLLAFAKALAVGVTHVETDVHVSADGVAMISHDPDLRRLADRRVTIHHLTAAELRRIDLGFGQNYCSLAEALDGFPDARFNIDIKIGDAVIPTVEAIRDAGATGRVLIGSFSPERRIAAVRMLPGVATSVSARGALGSVVAARSGSVGTLRRILRDVDAVQLPVSVLRMPAFTPRTIAAFHAAGVEVHAWTINDPPQMDRLLALGVDGLVSDRADLAMAAVARFTG
jgi:glycerophosphoryl diester phosphodiesterase